MPDIELTRDRSEAFAFHPSDAHGRLWARAPRPSSLDVQSDPDD